MFNAISNSKMLQYVKNRKKGLNKTPESGKKINPFTLTSNKKDLVEANDAAELFIGIAKHLYLVEGYRAYAYRGIDSHNITIGIGFNMGDKNGDSSAQKQYEAAREIYNTVTEDNDEIEFPDFDDLHDAKAPLEIEQACLVKKYFIEDAVEYFANIGWDLTCISNNELCCLVSKYFHGGPSVCPGYSLKAAISKMIERRQKNVDLEDEELVEAKNEADRQMLLFSDKNNATPNRQAQDIFMFQTEDFEPNEVYYNNFVDVVKKFKDRGKSNPRWADEHLSRWNKKIFNKK